jgi:hypothetical protein
MPRAAAQYQPAEYPSRRKRKAEQRSSKTPLYIVPPPKRRPSAVVAAERILMLIEEIGDDLRHERGWVNRVNKQLGLPATTSYMLRRRELVRVGTKVIDRVCTKIGLTVAELMDED